MTGETVTFTEGAAIVPRDAYIEHMQAVYDARRFVESTEAMGDDAFQAHVLLGVVYLLCRTFPDPHFRDG